MTSRRRLLIGEAVRTARGIHGNAVLMHDDRIVAVGDQRTLRQPGLRVENYEGAFLLPGMRDAHMHPVPYAASLFGISLEGVTSIGMLQETIRTASADLAPDASFVALRLDDASLAERRLPTRDDLDAAAPDRPVLVHRYCGHVAIANTAALRIAGIDRSTEDPGDGAIDRDDVGRPNGILRETAIDLVSTRLDASEAVTDDSLLRAFKGLAAMGITSIGAILGLGDGPWASLGDEVTRLVAVADRLPITALLSPTRSADSSMPHTASRLRATAFGGPATRDSRMEVLEVTRRQCTLRSPTGRTRWAPCASTHQTESWPGRRLTWAEWLRSTRSAIGRTAPSLISSKNSSPRERTRESSASNTHQFSSGRISIASPGSG